MGSRTTIHASDTNRYGCFFNLVFCQAMGRTYNLQASQNKWKSKLQYHKETGYIMRILLAGDIHGSKRGIDRAMYYGHDHAVDRVFFLGDFGWTFGPDFLAGASKVSKATGLMVEFIEGNHEDFDFLLSHSVSSDGYRYLNEHVRHIPRGTILELDDKRVMCMGGGVSIDKVWRVPGKSWWSQEEITDDDIDKAKNLIDATGPVHAMFTHDGPLLPGLSNKNFSHMNVDPIIMDDINRSNRHMRKVEDLMHICQPGYVYHGHHHVRNTDIIDAGHGSVVVECLDMYGSSVKNSLLVVETDDWTFE